MLPAAVLAALMLAAPPDGPETPSPPPPPPVAEPDAPATTAPKPVEWRADPRYGLLTPLPDRGGVPPIAGMLGQPTVPEQAFRARARQYERQIRTLQRKHFGSMRLAERRAEGIVKLREFVDPASFPPLIDVLADEQDDVRVALLEHLAEQSDDGQAALAWIFVHDDDPALRNEALRRLSTPVPAPVLRVIDAALRSKKHEVANNAGALAGALDVVQAIPLMIFAMATEDPVPEDQGDLAWIAIETQLPFVANLQPVVGDNAGAFQPIIGVVHEGVVLRVRDAVVVVYRTEVHRALVAMTTREFGASTAHLGYDMPAWWHWYNDEFVPHLRAEMGEPAPRSAAPAHP